MAVTVRDGRGGAPRRAMREQDTPYRSKEVVVVDGRMLYGIGHPIPEDEARRQGLIPPKAKAVKAPPEDKSIQPPATKTPRKRATPKPKEQQP